MNQLGERLIPYSEYIVVFALGAIVAFIDPRITIGIATFIILILIAASEMVARDDGKRY